MASIYLNNKILLQTETKRCSIIKNFVSEKTGLPPTSIYLEQNGRRLECNATVSGVTNCRLCLLGGKGGFGSMLRAIGAQIEKTTNREACRDLSGRRLRDINEEKRLKTVLEKMGELERDAKQRKKRKIEKLLAVPRHDFKDVEYEEARSKLEEKVNSAVEEGLKTAEDKPECSEETLKRKNTATNTFDAKKKKTALWIDDDLLDSDDSDDSSDEDSCTAIVASKEIKDDTKELVELKE